MNYKQKDLCRIRTITTFLTLNQEKASWRNMIEKAIRFCSDLSQDFLTGGYEVQSVRIVTNPFGEYLNTESGQTAHADLQFIRELLEELHTGKHRIRFAIGEAKTEKEIALLPELISSFGDLCNACVNITQDKQFVMIRLTNTFVNFLQGSKQ